MSCFFFLVDCGSSEAELKYSDKDVDFDNFIIPSDYNLEKVLHAVTDINVSNYFLLHIKSIPYRPKMLSLQNHLMEITGAKELRALRK